MAQIEVHDLEGKVVEQVDLPGGVFDGVVRLHLIHEMVKFQLASQRAGTHSTKGRAEVHGSNAKPFRQKGTGRARAGDVKSPIWRHGGTTFGPKPRDYTHKMNKKMKLGALRSALNLKWKEGKLKVVRDLDIEAPRTKLMIGALERLDTRGKTLLVHGTPGENFLLAVRNLQGTKPLSVEGLNVYDIMWHEHLVCTKDALGSLEKRLAG
ncbi:MAG: 50S ribosomal protein L4 [bacterium]|nr:50S ribosomal protein L4 [bacterium]